MRQPLALLTLLSLAACTGAATDSGVADGGATDGGAADGGGDGGGAVDPYAEPWAAFALSPVTPALEGMDTLHRVYRASGNDFVYGVTSPDGMMVRYLTGSYVQPSGELCLDEPGQQQSYDDCTATRYTPGRLSSSTASTAICLDDVDDRLIFVKSEGARLELAGTSKRGDTHLYYNRIYGFQDVALEEGDLYTGPCAARGGRIVLSGPAGLGFLTEVDGALTVGLRTEQAGGVEAMEWLGDSGWLVVHGKDGTVWIVDGETGARRSNLAPLSDARLVAVDPERSAVWMVRGSDAALVRVEVGHDGVGHEAEVPTCGRITEMAVDHGTGTVRALADCQGIDAARDLLVIGEQGVHLSIPLEEEPIALVPPGSLGHLAVIVRTPPGVDTAGEDLPAGAEIRAWAVQAPDDARPPITMWIVTTLEEPFSANPKVCTPEENASNNFGDLLDQLRENIPHLQATGLPVAVGLTWEFLNNAAYCDELGIVDELRAAGFRLGYMIHDRPCYSCTDGEVAGEQPDYCGPNDYDYDAPGSAAGCWPSNPNYCAWYDQQCWFDWTNAKQLDVDRWLQGSEFIFGADRHWLYGWEYIQGGYRVYDRWDGGKGYDITMFQGNWVYDDIAGQEDPRAKDPAPWSPELLGNTWFPGHCESWEDDSAFSELVYMPGNSIAVARLYDMQQYDLSMVHLTTEFSSITAQTNDFDVVLGLLGQAVGHRTDRPGSFYFHLPDLTGYAMQPGDDRPDYTVMLPAFAEAVERLYGEQGMGVVRWGNHQEVKGAVDAWVAAQGG